MGRVYFILGLVLFLFVGYWFVSHAYVFVRLTSVFGLMGAVAFVLVVLFYGRKLFK